MCGHYESKWWNRPKCMLDLGDSRWRRCAGMGKDHLKVGSLRDCHEVQVEKESYHPM